LTNQPNHGPTTTIHASKGGGAGKWLIGGVAAAVLAGGGYFVWQSMSPERQVNIDTAYNDQYGEEDPLRASPLPPLEDEPVAEVAALEESAAPPTRAPRAAAPRRAPARSEPVSLNAPVPEETIGITPINAVTDGDDIVIIAPPRPVWERTPSSRRLTELYPDQALQRGREGEASLHCIVQAGGALDCERVSSTPGGFGLAAMRVARGFRHAETTRDGQDAVGTPVNLRVVFRIEDEERRRG
jgi:outer membrane biosynthesis protein TonB